MEANGGPPTIWTKDSFLRFLRAASEEQGYNEVFFSQYDRNEAAICSLLAVDEDLRKKTAFLGHVLGGRATMNYGALSTRHLITDSRVFSLAQIAGFIGAAFSKEGHKQRLAPFVSKVRALWFLMMIVGSSGAVDIQKGLKTEVREDRLIITSPVVTKQFKMTTEFHSLMMITDFLHEISLTIEKLSTLLIYNEKHSSCFEPTDNGIDDTTIEKQKFNKYYFET